MQKLKLTIYFRRKIKVLFRVYISDIGTPVYSKTNITNNLTQKKGVDFTTHYRTNRALTRILLCVW